jgi:flagellar biogenesis protein FliO
MFEVNLSPTSMWSDYAKMLLILLGVCLLALVVVKLLIPRIAGLAPSTSNHIQLFARYPLEPRKMLYLVRAGKAVVLLASSGDSVHYMTSLSPEDFEISDIPSQADTARGYVFKRFMWPFADQKRDKSL